jgi:peptidoglycan/LPS O-acetylase OafA/YrhL
MTLTDASRHQSRSEPAVPLPPNTLRAFRPDIEGLRAIAVLVVVLDHSGLAVHGGYIGVDVFYVISGFLITSHLYKELSQSGHISIARFYARRVRRILPAATVVIIATLLAAWKWVSPLDIRSAGLDAITAALFCINYRIAETGANYFANTSPSPFQQYWSLAIEEQFYALWPLLLLAVTSSTRRLLSSRRAISTFLIMVIAASLICSVTMTRGSPSWAYFGLQTRAWELALGALVAINAEQLSRALRAAAGPLSWVGLAAIIAAAFCFTGATPYPGIAVVLPVVGAALVIAAGCAAPRVGAETALGLGPFQYVGRISYSWYLWHWPVLIFLPALLGHGPTTAEIVLALASSFVLASASYALVEQPFRKNQGLVRSPPRGLGVGAALIGVSVVSAVLVMTLVVVPAATGASIRPTASTTGNVALATHLRALPAALSPPLAAVPTSSPYNCIAPLTGGTLVPAAGWTPVCTLGDKRAKRTVALFGDSHAWQWTLPVAAVAAQRGWKLVTYTKAACPIDVDDFAALDGLYAPSHTHCAQWRQAAFARLSQLRPAVVIMSSRIYTFSTSKALTETIDRLKADGSKVVWLEDTPIPTATIPACLAQHPTDIQACSFSLAAGLDDPAGRAELDRTAARDGAEVVDTVPWLCTATLCPPVISNTVAYFDDSHVSNAYALKLTRQFSAALAVALPG